MKNIHGGDIYKYENITDFSANINPLGIVRGVREAVIDSVELCEHYPQMFCDELREKIGRKYGIDSGCIICGNGASDVLYRYVLAAKPKKAVVAAPCFAEYEAALECVGAESVHYNINHETFTVEDDFTEMFKYNPDTIFLCNPNNPTGILINPGLLERILTECDRRGVRLFLDECFLDFTGRERELSHIADTSKYRNLFILKAFTKMYAIPGLRLGYGITSDKKLIGKMYDAGAPWNVSVVAQKAGIAALDEDKFVSDTVKLINIEKNFIYDYFDKCGIKYWKSDANYIFFRHKKDLKKELLQKGILIRDCGNYANLSEGYFRIAVKLREDNERLLQALDSI